MEILQMSARELSKQICEGKISVRAVVEEYIEQIESKEPLLNAFISVGGKRLEERIRKVEEGIKSGQYKGALAGIPIAVKDNICTSGQETTCASKMLENFVPMYDAEAIKCLEEAGMIVIGKTNMDEFAMGSTTETSAFKVTKNPWNQAYVPGGSSGGSCVAVAAGEVPLAIGSDTGGSIRQPAAFCGVVGLKPTYGRVSRYGLIAYASSLDQIGPIGKNVGDCAALYEVLAGHDEKDSSSSHSSVDSLPSENNYYEDIKPQDVGGMKIGIPKEYLSEGTDENVKQAVSKVADLLAKNGAKVELFSLGMVDYVVPAYYIIACAEASANLERFDGIKYGYRCSEDKELHDMYKRSRTEGFGAEVRKRILLGSFVLSAGYYDAYYLKALKAKALIKQSFDEAFSKYDCILAPTYPGEPPRLGESLKDPLQMYLSDIYTVAANLAGLPAMSVPSEMNEQGIPVGIQLIGDCFMEEKIFKVAAAYEKMRGPFPTAWEKEEM